MYRGEEIVLNASEPLKLHYLEPWQMSSKYLKKIKMHFPFGVLFNLHENIWLSLSVYTARGPLSAFHEAVTAAEWAALSFCITSSSRGQVTNLPAWAKLPWSLMSHPLKATGGDLSFPTCWVSWPDTMTYSNETRNCSPDIPSKNNIPQTIHCSKSPYRPQEFQRYSHLMQVLISIRARWLYSWNPKILE